MSNHILISLLTIGRRFALVAPAFFAATALAAPGDLLFKITTPDPQPGAWFGNALSVVDGDILVGEPIRRLGLGLDARGRAYLFDGQTGALKLTFDNPEPTNQDVFGQSLAGGDGRVFIRTSGVEPRVYAFDATNGQFLETIYEPDRPGGHFGNNLAYGSGILLVSNPSFGLSTQLHTVGRAYLFDGAINLLQRPLPNPEPKAGDAFGIGVSPLAVFGNRAVVGAQDDDLPGDDDPETNNPGRVWVFDRLTGETMITLENPNPEKSPPHFILDFFGGSVAANEHVIAVGAEGEDYGGVKDSGAVYVFDSDTGALRHTLFSPQLEIDGEFGQSIAVTPEGNVLVGDRRNDVDGIENAGHAYLFDGLTGGLLLDIANPEPSRSAAFGWRVAAMHNRLIVGDFASTEGIYVFESVPEPSALVLVGVFVISLLAIQIARVRRK